MPVLASAEKAVVAGNRRAQSLRLATSRGEPTQPESALAGLD